MSLTRRQFVRRGALGAAGAAGAGLAATAVVQALNGDGAPTANDPDAGRDGFQLPPGFTVRLIARSGDVVSGTGYTMHKKPDGARCFPTSAGGWVHVSNSEADAVAGQPDIGGGVGAIRFDSRGRIIGAARLLGGTTANCAGGPTPWGTWLSCEETKFGKVWEVDPLGAVPPVAHDRLGWFAHEGCAVDADRRHIYMTEDKPDSVLYRAAYSAPGDLSAAVLQAATVAANGTVTWTDVPTPNPAAGATETRSQIPSATRFNGAEGIAIHDDVLYFDTKNDGVIWKLSLATQTMTSFYRQSDWADPPLKGLDTMIVSTTGVMFVCEDHTAAAGPLNLVAFALSRPLRPRPFLRLAGHGTSELTGVCFNPDQTRLYFASQRGIDGKTGLLYEVSGPFTQWMASL